MAGIVVPIVGSAEAQQALDWAVKDAGRRHAALTVLAVHEVAGNPETSSADAAETEKTRQAAQYALQKSLAAAGEPAPASVTVRVVSGITAQDLRDASRVADLIVLSGITAQDQSDAPGITERIVLGGRGGGGFTRQVLL
jgi:nucleotide-binding universal stress UspA family protein